MNRTNKTILSFALLLTIFITNASEELLRQLAREVDPNQAQQKARMFLKGDENKCLELFQQALKENNAVAQIYLANTYTTMRWSKDHEKDFSKDLQEEQLESYNFTRNVIDRLKAAYRKSDPHYSSYEWIKMEKMAHQTVDQAKKAGNLYANLVQILENTWSPWHFGLTCKLKPLIEKAQFPELLFSFGASLFSSGYYNQQFELEGLKYMEKSGFLNLKFFEDKKTHFSHDFNDYCEKHTERWHNFYDKYGMRLIGYKTILVPSKEHWQKFKEEKLETVQSSPNQLFDLFEKHDMDQIYNLIKKYKLHFSRDKYNRLPYLDIKSDVVKELDGEVKLTNIGEIKLTDIKSKSTSVSTQLHPQQKIIKELDPVINFLKDALSRCEDIHAVVGIMEDLEYDLALNPERA